MATDRTFYEVLGVDPGSEIAVIREAYRRRARQRHPDVAGPGPGAGEDMAEINRAWKVLSDPTSRAEYDSRIHRGSAAARAERIATPGFARVDGVAPLAPARVSWRALLALAAMGAAFVLLVDAFSSPNAPTKPDQLLASGSCVVLDARSEAVEVSCDGPHDAVVRQLVAFDRTCPFATEPHRDRQGMGIACLDVLGSGIGVGVQQGNESG